MVGADLFPLGIESGSISDDSLSASSEYSADNHAAKYARLHTESKKWCSKDNEKTPFIQVNFRKATKICAVGTRGRGVDLSYISYPTLYSVHLTNDSINWATVKHEGRKKVILYSQNYKAFMLNLLGNNYYSSFLHHFYIRFLGVPWEPRQLWCGNQSLTASRNCSNRSHQY